MDSRRAGAEHRVPTCEISSGSSGPFPEVFAGRFSPGNAVGAFQLLLGAGSRAGMLRAWPGHPSHATSLIPGGGKCLCCPTKTPVTSTFLTPPFFFFFFCHVKANVNPSNRNYSQEIPIMHSGALHPNSFKMFPSDFDLFFKTCLQFEKK